VAGLVTAATVGGFAVTAGSASASHTESLICTVSKLEYQHLGWKVMQLQNAGQPVPDDLYMDWLVAAGDVIEYC
jgi:hypothetical protein